MVMRPRSIPSCPPERLPTRRSPSFFAELGFEKTWEHITAMRSAVGGAYSPADANVPEGIRQMSVFESSLDAYWRAVDAKDLPSQFSA